MSTGRIVTSNSVQRLPEIGKLKVGEKVPLAQPKNGVTDRPSSLDYFRPTGKYAALFTEKFGEKPTRIPIVFISDNLDESCQENFQAWDGGKLQGKGDGEDFTVFDPAANGGKGDYVQVKKGHPLLNGKKWERWVTLRFLIPAIDDVLGVWTFATKGSKSSHPNILGPFDFVKDRAKSIIGFPFELTVSKVSGYTPGAAKNYPVVTLVPSKGQSAIDTVRKLILSGKSVTEFASVQLDESKLKEINDQFEDAVIVEDTKQLSEPAKAEPVEEKKPGTISPNPKAMVDEKGQAGLQL